MSAMLARKPDRERLDWSPKGKPQAMEIWAGRVLSDHRLSKTDIKVAWALSFGFNNDDARCWQTKETIAKSAGLSESSVKSALAALDNAGHISRTTEPVRGTNMRVIRPTLTRQFGMPTPRPRKGGVAKGVNPRAVSEAKQGTDPQSTAGTDPQSPERTDPQSPRRTDVQAPCIHDQSRRNPGDTVAGRIAVPPPPEPDDDDDWDDSFPVREE